MQALKTLQKKTPKVRQQSKKLKNGVKTNLSKGKFTPSKQFLDQKNIIINDIASITNIDLLKENQQNTIQEIQQNANQTSNPTKFSAEVWNMYNQIMQEKLEMALGKREVSVVSEQLTEKIGNITSKGIIAETANNIIELINTQMELQEEQKKESTLHTVETYNVLSAIILSAKTPITAVPTEKVPTVEITPEGEKIIKETEAKEIIKTTNDAFNELIKREPVIESQRDKIITETIEKAVENNEIASYDIVPTMLQDAIETQDPTALQILNTYNINVLENSKEIMDLYKVEYPELKDFLEPNTSILKTDEQGNFIAYMENDVSGNNTIISDPTKIQFTEMTKEIKEKLEPIINLDFVEKEQALNTKIANELLRIEAPKIEEVPTIEEVPEKTSEELEKEAALKKQEEETKKKAELKRIEEAAEAERARVEELHKAEMERIKREEGEKLTKEEAEKEWRQALSDFYNIEYFIEHSDLATLGTKNAPEPPEITTEIPAKVEEVIKEIPTEVKVETPQDIAKKEMEEKEVQKLIESIQESYQRNKELVETNFERSLEGKKRLTEEQWEELKIKPKEISGKKIVPEAPVTTPTMEQVAKEPITEVPTGEKIVPEAPTIAAKEITKEEPKKIPTAESKIESDVFKRLKTTKEEIDADVTKLMEKPQQETMVAETKKIPEIVTKIPKPETPVTTPKMEQVLKEPIAEQVPTEKEKVSEIPTVAGKKLGEEIITKKVPTPEILEKDIAIQRIESESNNVKNELNTIGKIIETKLQEEINEKTTNPKEVQNAQEILGNTVHALRQTLENTTNAVEILVKETVESGKEIEPKIQDQIQEQINHAKNQIETIKNETTEKIATEITNDTTKTTLKDATDIVTTQTAGVLENIQETTKDVLSTISGKETLELTEKRLKKQRKILTKKANTVARTIGNEEVSTKKKKKQKKEEISVRSNLFGWLTGIVGALAINDAEEKMEEANKDLDNTINELKKSGPSLFEKYSWSQVQEETSRFKKRLIPLKDITILETNQKLNPETKPEDIQNLGKTADDIDQGLDNEMKKVEHDPIKDVLKSVEKTALEKYREQRKILGTRTSNIKEKTENKVNELIEKKKEKNIPFGDTTLSGYAKNLGSKAAEKTKEEMKEIPPSGYEPSYQPFYDYNTAYDLFNTSGFTSDFDSPDFDFGKFDFLSDYELDMARPYNFGKTLDEFAPKVPGPEKTEELALALKEGMEIPIEERIKREQISEAEKAELLKQKEKEEEKEIEEEMPKIKYGHYTPYIIPAIIFMAISCAFLYYWFM